MELRKLTIDSPDIPVLEKINEEAIPECERNSLGDLMNTGATVLGIYEDGPVGFMVIREYKTILYLAYLAVNSTLRSKGIGGKAMSELVSGNVDNMIVVEYEASNPASPGNELNIRRKGFYKRNGFSETGYFTFYDDTEFEIGCAGKEFDVELFGEFTEHLSSIVSDHIPKPYKKQKIMAIKSEIPADLMHKTGRDLLPVNIVEDFMNSRSALHVRIVCRTLSEYTRAEWIICLKEKVLLEQCLPYISEILEVDPLSPGLFAKGELLYDVTQIDKRFWMSHHDWLEYFRKIIYSVLNKIENDANTQEINKVYIESYKGFLVE